MEVAVRHRLKGISSHIKENLSNSLQDVNKHAGELIEDIMALGRSSVSLGKMIFGSKVSKRDEEIVKQNVKQLGNVCIEITSNFLLGGKKILSFVNNIIENKTPGFLEKVVDNEMKTEWLNTINTTKNNPSLIEKIIYKIKENNS